MPRPEPTKSAQKLESDILIVRPYARGIIAAGMISVILIILVLTLVKDTAIAAIALSAIVLLTTQFIGYLLILAKQVEFVHRMNSRLDELLESSGLSEYLAGEKQGRADLQHEINQNATC